MVCIDSEHSHCFSCSLDFFFKNRNSTLCSLSLSLSSREALYPVSLHRLQHTCIVLGGRFRGAISTFSLIEPVPELRSPRELQCASHSQQKHRTAKLNKTFQRAKHHRKPSNIRRTKRPNANQHTASKQQTIVLALDEINN